MYKPVVIMFLPFQNHLLFYSFILNQNSFLKNICKKQKHISNLIKWVAYIICLFLKQIFDMNK